MSGTRSSPDPRAAALIEKLELSAHTEGGYFCEVDRSPSRVQPLDGRPERRALTTIYFLLTAGDVSRAAERWLSERSRTVGHYVPPGVLPHP